MPAAKKKEFDVDLFRKCVRHFDNASVNERDAFILQALKQCAECDLLFCDAARLAFGGSGNDDELRTRLDAALSDNARLEDENQKLRDGVQALNEELEEQRNAGVRDREGSGFAGLIGEAWSMSQVRLALFLGLIALRLSFVLLWGDLAWWANVLVCMVVLWGFVKWSGRQYEQSGLGAAALKLVIFGGGVWLALSAFFGDSSCLGWFHKTDVDGNSVFGFIVLFALLLVELSSVPERLVQLSLRSDNRVFVALRWWFANPM